MKFLIAAVCCVAVAFAIPPPETKTRNTIFNDEKLEGQVFEDLDVFSTAISTRDSSDYRLPTTTKPSRYTVLWSIDFTNFAFAGTVTIELSAQQAGVSEIVLHAEDLIISSATLTQGTTNVAFNMVEQPEYNFLVFQLQTGTLEYNADTPVVYQLTISFEAALRNDMYGIYRSWYNNNGTVRWMATTQFQATAARKAFPCYDEPSFKAYFDITIRRPIGYRSWSNMRIANTTTSTAVTGYEEDEYYTTPYMSTYLIAIIVSEYDSLDVYDNNGDLTYEVIARSDALDEGQGDYALEVGQALLAEMSNHTGIDFYSMAENIKMTQASIPDFSAGAMENWGLLTYREAYLMYHGNHTNSYFKQIIAYILSHEIAHMWFGNLATCEWWDVLWLNEGFARYYQYFLTHWVETDMGFETRFIIEQVHTSLLSDSANNPHALNNPGVGTPAEVSAMFSTISYNKGAAIIRQTEHLLGFEVHRSGLNRYLTQYAYDVAYPINLFESLLEVANETGALDAYGSEFNFVDYYYSWTDQPGHPVLNVHVDHSTGDMTIQQVRFNINTGVHSTNLNYIVPITFSTASNPDFTDTKPSHIITDSVTVINRGSVGDEWVIFNKQQTGFYRVNYDDYTWDLIITVLKSANRTLIHEYNRAQIVNDVFQFARSGLMTYTRAFNILSFLEDETDYAPWVAAITGFSWIRNRLVGTNELAGVNALLASWATNVMNEIGYYATENEEFMRSYLRWQLAPVMCAMENAACRAAATAQFAALRDESTEVFVDNRNFVYCNALRDGTVEDFNHLWTRYQSHNVYTEKIVLLQTVGCSPHETALNTFMDAIVQENELVRPQDYTTAWNTAVAGNEANTQIAFTYVQQNLDTVRTAFGGLSLPLSYISARLRSEAEVVAFQTWATNNQEALGTEYAAIYNGAENSRDSMQWAAEVAADINEYLNNGDQAVDTTTAATVTDATTTTVATPVIVEPETPSVPDSAATSVLSSAVAVIAVAYYVL